MGDAAKKLEQPDWLTVEEVAVILRIGRNQAYQAVANGDIKAKRLGRTIRVRRRDIEND